MARKSKQQMALQAAETAVAQWRVGAYLRLSVENSGGKTENTIDNQRKAVLALIATQHNMSLHEVYCDNGETGTDFDRPAFDRLMTDLRDGVINCVVVKDLSRFGRNYLEAGTLLEQTFPAMGVRFVAIQEGFDTLTAQRSSEGYIVPLRNILNDMYAKDISLKAGSALRIKQQQGDFIGAWAAYGYLKDPQNKHRLVVDEPAAEVVRQMFRWKAEGLGNGAIACRLSQQKVLSPSAYRYTLGLMKQPGMGLVPWRANTVKAILQNPVYLGQMAQGRKRASLYLSQKQQRLPQEEWIVVQDTHPAIIGQELFDAVQAALAGRREAYRERQWEDSPQPGNPLKGLLICGCCGSKLTRHKSRNRRKDDSYGYYYEYICPRHGVDCGFSGIGAKAVLEAVEQAVRMQVEVFAELEELVNLAKPSADEERRTQEKTLRGKLAEKQAYRKKLLESLSQGRVDEVQFAELQQGYRAEIERLQSELAVLSTKRWGEAQGSRVTQEKCEQLRTILNDGLTGKLARALIKKIVVGQDRTIEVVFLFKVVSVVLALPKT